MERGAPGIKPCHWRRHFRYGMELGGHLSRPARRDDWPRSSRRLERRLWIARRDSRARAMGTPSSVRLGLRENAPQFILLVVVNAFVGAMAGLERSILPL